MLDTFYYMKEVLTVFRTDRERIDREDSMGYWKAATKLFPALCDGGTNSLFSPACLVEALRIVQIGSEGKTRDDLDELLGSPDVAEGKEMAERLGLPTSPLLDERDYIAHAALALWLDKHAESTVEFLNQCESLLASPKYENLVSPTVSAKVSNWIEHETEGLLKPGIEIDPLARACVASALYFKDSWKKQFDRSNTETRFFHAPDGDTKTKFMKGKRWACLWELDNFLVFELRFSAGAGIIFVLPADGVPLKDLMKDGTIVKVFKGFHEHDQIDQCEIELRLPKFSCETESKSVCSVLRQLGYEGLETPNLFPAIGNPEGDLAILHGAKIALDEDGIEAAAYTAAMMRLGCAPAKRPEPRKVTLDRPFAYAVLSPGGQPLFMGTVADPSNYDGRNERTLSHVGHVKFTIGGFFEGYPSATVRLGGAPCVHVQKAFEPDDEGGLQTARGLEWDEVDALHTAMESANVLEWEEHYSNPGVLDGVQWELKVWFLDGSKFESSGSNAFPQGFNELFSAFVDLGLPAKFFDCESMFEG